VFNLISGGGRAFPALPYRCERTEVSHVDIRQRTSVRSGLDAGISGIDARRICMPSIRSISLAEPIYPATGFPMLPSHASGNERPSIASNRPGCKVSINAQSFATATADADRRWVNGSTDCVVAAKARTVAFLGDGKDRSNKEIAAAASGLAVLGTVTSFAASLRRVRPSFGRAISEGDTYDLLDPARALAKSAPTNTDQGHIQLLFKDGGAT
jgi:hypothetical protein